MSAGAPLAGKTIVVTRPRAQALPLAEAIGAAGGKPLFFPLLEISPAADPQPLRQAISCLADYTFAVFISPNAVDYAVPAILARGSWPESLTPAAVGPGTVKALAAFGIFGCIAPVERFDSEGLLALPEMASVSGRRVAIFRGDGGRELLAETLRQRGAMVDCVTCYRRAGPPDGVATLIAAWRAGKLDALTVSSSEGLRYLIDLLDVEGRNFLHKTPVFVPHARIAEVAEEMGLSNIILTEGADTGILAGLSAYNWSK